jgi:hypothetical protein
MSNIEIELVGKLKSHPDVPDEWFISKPISVPFFDGSELRFVFDCDLENDESYLFDTNRTVINFLSKNAGDRLKASDSVYKYYREVQDYYASEPYVVAPLEMNDETDIWKYVRPYEIYICRGFEEDRNIYLQVHCGCEWEEEHGLQLVFKNGLELTKTSGIDCEPI